MIEAQVASGMPPSAASAVRVIGVPDSTSFSRIVKARSTAGEGALSMACLVIAHPRLPQWVLGSDEQYYPAPGSLPRGAPDHDAGHDPSSPTDPPTPLDSDP